MLVLRALLGLEQPRFASQMLARLLSKVLGGGGFWRLSARLGKDCGGKARLLGLGVPSLGLEEHPQQSTRGNVYLLP